MNNIYNSLSEIDTLANLEALAAHIDANGWVHLYNEIDYVKHLESVNKDLLHEKEKREAITKGIESAINQIDKITIQLLKSAEFPEVKRINNDATKTI